MTYGSGYKGDVEKYVTDSAHVTHSLQVRDALTDTIGLFSNRVSAQARTKGGMQYLLYGVGRPLLMMWHAYTNVVWYLAHPRRSQPLSGDESGELTRDLNVIYINIRGILDNLAWALLHEYAQDKLKIQRQKIGLFKPCIANDPQFEPLSLKIRTYRGWYVELADRRDPSAHRIPLTVPPQQLLPKEVSEYERLLNGAAIAEQSMDFEVGDHKRKQTQRIGQFCPYFIHDIDEKPIPIHPTLPEDVGQTVEVCLEVGEFFLARER